MISSLCFGVFGGAGMVVLPLKLILAWSNQPKRPNAEQHILAKNILNQWSENLIMNARDVYESKKEIQVTEMLPLMRKMKLKKLNKDANELETNVLELMGVFDIFKKEDNIVDNNPLVYLSYLGLGLFFLLFSMIF